MDCNISVNSISIAFLSLSSIRPLTALENIRNLCYKSIILENFINVFSYKILLKTGSINTHFVVTQWERSHNTNIIVGFKSFRDFNAELICQQVFSEVAREVQLT